MPVLRSPLAGGDLLTADTDLDYLFLEHIRLDGDSPASLPKYEAPLASSSNGECVSDPSPGRLSSNRRAVEERESSSTTMSRLRLDLGGRRMRSKGKSRPLLRRGKGSVWQRGAMRPVLYCCGGSCSGAVRMRLACGSIATAHGVR
jgi:hypothetical protein